MSDVRGPLVVGELAPGGGIPPQGATPLVSNQVVMVVPERAPARTPELGFVLAVWWSGFWRWLIAWFLLSVPAGLFAAWYMIESGLNFFESMQTLEGVAEVLSVLRWAQWCAGLPASVWALRAALSKHGIVGNSN